MRFPRPFSKTRSDSLNEAPANFAPWSDFWYQPAAGGRRSAGEIVNATTAQNSAAVYACKTAIGESLAMLPCTLLNEVDEQKKVKDPAHPLYILLRDAPNSFMDSFTFFETMQHSACENGNAVAFIQRTKSKRIRQLLPLLYERMDVKVLANGDVGYTYRNVDGTSTQYSSTDIFHLRNQSKDGIIGRCPVTAAVQVVANALALQTHTNSTFENGASQSGMLRAPFKFKDNEARAGFIDSFKNLFGAKNAGKVGVLEQGVDWVKIGQDNVAAQLLGLREFSVLEICRVFRVPPVMIQVMDKGMAFASVEQLAILFVQYTIQPWVTRWERAIKAQLLRDVSDADRFVRFNINALLRGDLKSRTEAVVAQLGAGLKTINEGRHLLDDNRTDDPLGDKLLLSNNLRPAETVTAADAPQDNPATDAAPDNEVPNSVADTGTRSLREATSPLVSSLLGRLWRREQDQLKVAAEKRADFAKWAEEFYAKHRELVTETLGPACYVLKKDYEQLLERFVEDLILNRAGHIAVGSNAADIVSRIRADDTNWSTKLLDVME